MTTIRLLVALATIHHSVFHQMDVKTTFLYEKLNKEVYIKILGGLLWRNREQCV